MARVRSGGTWERLLDKPAWYLVGLETPKKVPFAGFENLVISASEGFVTDGW